MHREDYLLHVAGEALGVLHTVLEMVLSTVEVVVSELWGGIENLQDGIHVTRISQVLKAGEPSSKLRDKLFSLFQDFRKSEVEVSVKVQFGHSLFSLNLVCDLDSELMHVLS